MHKEPALAFVVADAGRARLLLRHSDGRYEELDSFDAAPAHRQGQDTRGRVHASVGEARSAVGEPNHDLVAQHFAATVAERVEALCEAGEIARFVLAAPPRMLAAVRERLGPRARERAVGELANDLTRLPEPKLREALEQVSLQPVPNLARGG